MSAAPRGRDTFVDLLRGGSILAVVVGHWLVADLAWQDGRVVQASALGLVPQMWPLTWLLVVIPLFFFVGGFSNRRSWEGSLRRGEGYAAFLDRRVHRVMVPTGFYLAVTMLAGVAIDRVGGGGIRQVGGLFLQPLWFLGVYLWVVALTPLTLGAHHRFGWRVPVALAGLAAIVDVLRHAPGASAVGYVNVLVVWLLMHQLGYFLAEGSLTRPGTMAAVGLAVTAALVALPAYSATMVGVPGSEEGNMHPPTLAIVSLGLASIGVVLLVRDPLTRWLRRAGPWRAVVVLNMSMISIYLWHQPALAIAARIALPLGYPHPEAGTPGWWVAHVSWLALPAAVLAGIVVLVGRVERVGPPRPAPASTVTARAAVAAVVVLGMGLLSLAGSSATEPFAPGQALGPVVASPVAGLSGVGLATLVFVGLRRGPLAARACLLWAAAGLLVVAVLWTSLLPGLGALVLAVAAVPAAGRPARPAPAG